jgi:3-oxoacyl-[acyl-carrier protein] reductase
MSLQGKVGVVTGAGRGIGRAVARSLAAGGAAVVVNDRDQAVIDDCVRELRGRGWQAAPAVADVSDSTQVNDLFAEVERVHGRLDILVNNAAVSRPRPLAETTDEDWLAVLTVNLSGVFYCCRAAFRLMERAGGGRVINLSSVSAYTGRVLSSNAAYVASKAGVDGLTRALAREGLAHGITVNSVAPGVVETELHAHLPPDARARLPSLVPSGRLASADEVAEVVRFLASAESDHITGQVIHLNGGMYFS